ILYFIENCIEIVQQNSTILTELVETTRSYQVFQYSAIGHLSIHTGRKIRKVRIGSILLALTDNSASRFFSNTLNSSKAKTYSTLPIFNHGGKGLPRGIYIRPENRDFHC